MILVFVINVSLLVMLSVEGASSSRFSNNQPTKYVDNPYLSSFRTGSVTLPTPRRFGLNFIITSATYDAPLVNSTSVKCYCFVSSFDANFDGQSLSYGLTTDSCS